MAPLQGCAREVEASTLSNLKEAPNPLVKGQDVRLVSDVQQAKILARLPEIVQSLGKPSCGKWRQASTAFVQLLLEARQDL